MTVSIKDIAKKVGVSVSTVSYALNNGPKPVAPQLRQRILDAAKELDYHPRHLARSLKRRKSDSIGFIHSHMTFDIMRSPAIHEAIVGISNACQEQGKDLLIYTHFDRLEERGLLSMVLDGRVDGAIIFAPENQEALLEALDQRNFPYAVVLGCSHPSRLVYGIDNVAGVDQAVQHLYDLGHREIGHLSGRMTMHDGRQRDEAFRASMKARGLKVRDEWIASGQFEYRPGFQAAASILAKKHRPTALFCGNDMMATGALDAAREAGLTVPSDLSIVGFDDVAGMDLISPGLTTVRQPIENLGRRALEAVVQLAEGLSVPQPEIISPTLIVRGSTAPTKEPIK